MGAKHLFLRTVLSQFFPCAPITHLHFLTFGLSFFLYSNTHTDDMFWSELASVNQSIWSSDSWSKAVLNIYSKYIYIRNIQILSYYLRRRI
jgi:hypothetical protein